MKILQIITELRIAGAERIIASLSCELRKKGCAVGVVSLRPFPEDERMSVIPQLREAGVQLFSLNVSKATPWRLHRLKAVVREFDPDLVHSHLIHANLASRFFAGSHGVPIINTVHIAESRSGAWWHFQLDRWTIGRCSVQTAVSESVRDFHAGKLGVCAQSMPVIRNGIDPLESCSPAQKRALRKTWGVAECTKVIGSVGRLNPQKGYDRLLSALPELGQRIPADETWGLVILGEGPQRHELNVLQSRSPGNLRVALPGFRPDAAACIGAFDLFIMPSRYEGFGLTLAEAMAHGIPILCADLEVLKEVGRNYPSIEFCSFGAPVQTARALLAALNLQRCGTFQPFPLTKMADQYHQLYQELR